MALPTKLAHTVGARAACRKRNGFSWLFGSARAVVTRRALMDQIGTMQLSELFVWALESPRVFRRARSHAGHFGLCVSQERAELKTSLSAMGGLLAEAYELWGQASPTPLRVSTVQTLTQTYATHTCV